MAASATGDLCACGSGRDYAACCEPAISGIRPAATPEALMRSRYTAYTRNDNAYLLATWHRSTRPLEAPCDETVDWQGLDIIRSTGNNPDDREGTVEFNARCLVNGRPGGLHEVSSFVREDSVWFYLDGTARPPIRNENKTGRNEPCPCGSGLKYKRCCGA